MPNTWITDVRHYLDAKGNLPPELHPKAANLARYQGKIIMGVTSFSGYIEYVDTGIPCRRRPGHKSCPGNILAFIDKEEGRKIRWSCPICRDNGWISGWQETMWDKSYG